MTPKAQAAARERSRRYAYANRARKRAAGLCGVCNRPRVSSTYYCPDCTIRMRMRRRIDPIYLVERLPDGLFAVVLKGRNTLPDRVEAVYQFEAEAERVAIEFRKKWEADQERKCSRYRRKNGANGR